MQGATSGGARLPTPPLPRPARLASQDDDRPEPLHRPLARLPSAAEAKLEAESAAEIRYMNIRKDFSIGEKLGEGSFGAVYAGLPADGGL